MCSKERVKKLLGLYLCEDRCTDSDYRRANIEAESNGKGAVRLVCLVCPFHEANVLWSCMHHVDAAQLVRRIMSFDDGIEHIGEICCGLAVLVVVRNRHLQHTPSSIIETP